MPVALNALMRLVRPNLSEPDRSLVEQFVAAEDQAAFAALVDLGQAIGDGVIWFAIVWLPALVVLGVVILVAMRFVPVLRRRIGGAAKE